MRWAVPELLFEKEAEEEAGEDGEARERPGEDLSGRNFEEVEEAWKVEVLAGVLGL